jgi:hypothetical protein
MHGTFPRHKSEGRSSTLEVSSLLVGLAFAIIPLIMATLAALLRFGSAVTVADIVGILVTATSSAPL